MFVALDALIQEGIFVDLELSSYPDASEYKFIDLDEITDMDDLIEGNAIVAMFRFKIHGTHDVETHSYFTKHYLDNVDIHKDCN